jgi:tetratricopeptide (TPR) repeat protein
VTDPPTEPDNEGAWAKLRRRKVVQWGMTYAAGAWALLQVWGFAACLERSRKADADDGGRSAHDRDLRVLVRLDPVNGDAWSDLGFGYMVFGRYPAAIAAFRKSLEFAPDAVFTHELLGEAMLLSGDRNGALAEMQLEPHDIMRRVGLSFVYAALRRREESQRAPKGLARSIRTLQARWLLATRGSARPTRRLGGWTGPCGTRRGVLEVRSGPLFQPLRADPRWEPLLRRIGLSDEQVAGVGLQHRRSLTTFLGCPSATRCG